MNKINKIKKGSISTLLFTALALTVSSSLANKVVVLNNNQDLFESQSRNQAQIYQQDMDGLENQKAVSLNKTETMNEILNKKVPTAHEQGFSNVDQDKLDRIEQDRLNNDNARQKGEVVTVTSTSAKSTLFNSKKDRNWLKNWAYILQDKGVPQSKTYYMAKKMDKEEFEEWANEIYNSSN